MKLTNASYDISIEIWDTFDERLVEILYHIT